MKKEVAVIVVTYNRLTLLQECINALRSQTVNNFQVIVVDNGSTDGTQEYLALQSDILTITQSNSGGAGGFFTGIKYAAENGYEYSWVMDDDTIPTPKALEELWNSSKSLDDFGFICSKVIDVEGNSCNYPTVDYKKSSNGEFQWLNDTDKDLIRVTTSSFVSVLLNNEYVIKYGLPYSEFFIWGDDSEYTYRLSVDHLSYVALKSVAIHKRKQNQTLSIFSEDNACRVKNYYYLYRNRIFFISKQSKVKAIGWWFRSLIDAINLLIHGQVYKSKIVFKALFAAIFFSPKIVYPFQ